MADQLRELISIPSVNPDQVTRTGGDPMSDPACGEHAYPQTHRLSATTSAVAPICCAFRAFVTNVQSPRSTMRMKGVG